MVYPLLNSNPPSSLPIIQILRMAHGSELESAVINITIADRNPPQIALRNNAPCIRGSIFAYSLSNSTPMKRTNIGLGEQSPSSGNSIGLGVQIALSFGDSYKFPR
jgi:hypothetical protein